MEKTKPHAAKLLRVVYYEAHILDGGEPAAVEDEQVRDLLRYDLAFMHPSYPGVVAFPEFSVHGGNLGGRPTVTRWRSWRIGIGAQVRIEPHEVRSVERFPETWYTFRHPTEEGRPNYTKLVRMALPALLKDLVEPVEPHLP